LQDRVLVLGEQNFYPEGFAFIRHLVEISSATHGLNQLMADSEPNAFAKRLLDT
jgi:hypothetical protein